MRRFSIVKWVIGILMLGLLLNSSIMSEAKDSDAYTITFNSLYGYIDGQSEEDTTTVIVNQGMSLYDSGIYGGYTYGRPGFVCVGWRTEGDDNIYYDASSYSSHIHMFSGKYIHNYIPTKDTVFTAVWEEAWEVKFYSLEGYIFGSDDHEVKFMVRKGDSLWDADAVESPDNWPGHYFVGWKVENDETYYSPKSSWDIKEWQKSLAEYVPTGNTTFVAEWMEAYEVCFKSEEGYIYNAANCYESSITQIKCGDALKDYIQIDSMTALEGRKGWGLLGWKIEDNDTLFVLSNSNLKDGEEYLFDYIPTKNTTFIAVWTEAFNITYYSEYGGVGSDNDDKEGVVQVIKGDPISTTYTMWKNPSGYKFAGWKTEGDDSLYVSDYKYLSEEDGIKYLYDYVPTKDTTFTAEWREQCVVTYKSNEGYIYGQENNKEVNYHFAKGFKIADYLVVKDRPGYTFVGWKVDGDDFLYVNTPFTKENEINIYNYKVTEDVTFVAQWKKDFLITFYSNEGYLDGDPEKTEYSILAATGEYLSNVYLPYGREGYTAIGWRTDDDNILYVPNFYSVNDGQKSICDYIPNNDAVFIVVWEKNSEDPHVNIDNKYTVLLEKSKYTLDFSECDYGNQQSIVINISPMLEGTENEDYYYYYDYENKKGYRWDYDIWNFNGGLCCSSGHYENDKESNITKLVLNVYPYYSEGLGDDNLGADILNVWITVDDSNEKIIDVEIPIEITDNNNSLEKWNYTYSVTYDTNQEYMNIYKIPAGDAIKYKHFTPESMDCRSFVGWKTEGDDCLYKEDSYGLKNGEKYIGDYVPMGDVIFVAQWSDDIRNHVPAVSVKENEVEPTCETEGLYDEVVYCSMCGEEISRKTYATDMLGHDYRAPIYTWSEDRKKCTASVTCNREGCTDSVTGHKITEEAVVSSTVKEDSTTEKKGTTTYTAAFNNKLFTAQNMDIIDIPIKEKTDNPVDRYNDNSDNMKSIEPAKEETMLEVVEVKAKVVVTSKAGGESTVEYIGTTDKMAKVVKIPEKVTVNGVTYKVTVIANCAFEGNKTIEKVEIGKNIETIDNKAFEGCTNLKAADIPESVTVIGDDAFRNCINLKKVKMTKNIVEIGNNAFNGCKKLKTFSTGDNVETIGTGAFANCKALTTFTMTARVKNLGNNIFKGANKLKKITVKTTKLTTMNVSKNAFKGIGKKVIIKVPKKMKKSYTKMFRKKGLNKKIKIQ